jgi:hypothetical protein
MNNDPVCDPEPLGLMGPLDMRTQLRFITITLTLGLSTICLCIHGNVTEAEEGAMAVSPAAVCLSRAAG